MNKIKKFIWTSLFTVYSGLIFYGSIYPVQQGGVSFIVPGLDKIIHAGEFFVFTLIGYKTFSYYMENKGRRVRLISTSLFYGGLTEFSQLFFPYRTASWLDFLANLFGIVAGLMAMLIIEKYKTNVKKA